MSSANRQLPGAHPPTPSFVHARPAHDSFLLTFLCWFQLHRSDLPASFYKQSGHPFRSSQWPAVAGSDPIFPSPCIFRSSYRDVEESTSRMAPIDYAKRQTWSKCEASGMGCGSSEPVHI